MKRPKLRRSAMVSLACCALFAAASAAGKTQTWHWQYVTRTPHVPAFAAQSAVVLEGGQLRMTYTVPLQKRQVVIESCRAPVHDVSSATTVRTQGRTYLLVQLRPAHLAACLSGQRPTVALPADDEYALSEVVSAINRSCCSTASAVAVTSTPVPLPIASASPKAVLTIAAADWVESQGVFAFVRVRNLSAAAFNVRAIQVLACEHVALGCGQSKQQLVVGPRRIITIATVASTDQHSAPSFAYRYVAERGAETTAHGGSSAASTVGRTAPMSAAEVRAAEAGALGDLRSEKPRVAVAAPVPDTFAPARLLRRGSSRLAIGQTGTALVRLIIAETGTPQEATIVSITNRRLAAAAIETAVSSTYTPALKNGKPVAAKYIATFAFDGEDPALATIPSWKRSPSPVPTTVEPAEPAPASAPPTQPPAPNASPPAPSPTPNASPPAPCPTPNASPPAPSPTPT